ncbi:hypothetical protein ASPWEDRAFT_35338 [Aspergillus wentii DTO 134E9]|uniref:Nuclear pore complex component n=1 Tax=Aspergillus wentii DTO 134E9 TaxID=1073089 RepID=A0A1L9S3K9_ASPWE|nr:uncharacterized protein ASPWEDRAFT_35338 [Aspergillus wentii DTO 134E9]KAI9930074.1 hypothetical protein MW887_011884 [Aspergillus wentii]OJJ41736.1 hypothetical protein ASPWEDRAFT_35338 [Aspergillus wentii DTO 134E9]
MASLPSTPKPASAPKPAPDESRTPGKWRHPHLDEIVKRQNAASFGDRNIKKLLWNGAALAATWVFGNTVRSYTLRLQSFDQSSSYSDLPLLILRLFFALNILVALFPLFRPKDDLSDIPLTPTQRSLLGLDPSATPPLTPGTTYVTPPRYRLSASRTASPASRSASPLSTGTNMSGRRGSSSTPFSPSTSPLLYKAVSNGNRDNGRRQSFGSSSPFGRSSPFKESLMPATPSPVGGKRVSLGLSNKWLYERGSRRLSASNGTL